MNAIEFEEIKKKIEAGKTALARAEGGLQQSLKTLQTEFGVDSIESAQALFESLKKEETEAEERLNVLLSELKDVVRI